MTYSIVARDPATGELGVAVQSHFFGVGSLVSWAEAGVGAVATQSIVEPAFGPRGLDLMRAGAGAADALDRLLADDSQPQVRQVALIDSQGRAAAHTGERCIAEAGHRLGEQVSAQANMMAGAGVWDAMVSSYRDATADLAGRLLAALEGAEDAGGDLRGRQSAALVVVAPRPGERVAGDRLVDLRVDDHADPLTELGRLLGLRRAYAHIDTGDELAAAGDVEGALAEYAAAHGRYPDNAEFAFWHGAALAADGREEEARPLLEQAFETHDGWRELLARLPAAGLFPDDPGLLERLAGR